MKYCLDKNNTPEIELVPTDSESDIRWVLHKSSYFIKLDTGKSIEKFARKKPGDKILQKTSLALCEDDFYGRTVLVKTVLYEDNELDDINVISEKRRRLNAQIDVLNSAKSNMLPEPLDFFMVRNDFDKFKGDAKKLKESEPVLVLDYFPGEVLSAKLSNGFDKSFYRSDGNSEFVKRPENINEGTVARLVSDILSFEMDLYDKGLAYTSLSTDHIILLGDNKPRFVGLGRICPIDSDRFDSLHCNFGRQLIGYSAPEFNSSENGFGKSVSVKAGLSFNLGVLFACIILSKTVFDEKELINGGYDYYHDKDSRDRIQMIDYGKGERIDRLICRLTDPNPLNRLVDFSEILNELALITGDAKEEKEAKYVLEGVVKVYFDDRKFGFITSGGKDYHFSTRTKSVSLFGDVPQKGQKALFVPDGISSDKPYVKEFVKPTPPFIWPRFPRGRGVRRDTIPQPIPNPAPQPRPQPVSPSTPQPRPQPIPTFAPKPGINPEPMQPRKTNASIIQPGKNPEGNEYISRLTINYFHVFIRTKMSEGYSLNNKYGNAVDALQKLRDDYNHIDAFRKMKSQDMSDIVSVLSVRMIREYFYEIVSLINDVSNGKTKTFKSVINGITGNKYNSNNFIFLVSVWFKEISYFNSFRGYLSGLWRLFYDREDIINSEEEKMICELVIKIAESSKKSKRLLRSINAANR